MAELHLHMAGPTVGVLRRFRISLDGTQVAALKQGEDTKIVASAGRHELVAKLDWHRSEPLPVDLSDGQPTRVTIEYVWLLTDSFTKPAEPFKFTVG